MSSELKSMHMGQVTSFFIPNVTLVGQHCSKEIPNRLKALGGKHPLVVTDKGIVACGILKQITDILDAAKVAYTVFDGAVPNPTDKNVEDATKVYLDNKCDSLISIGGGSSHDCAKGVGFVAGNGGRIQDYEGVDKSSKPFPPYVAVNTTAGTGSEMTRFCIITDTARKVKMAIIDWRCTPSVAIDDPVLMMGMPPSLTAATGMDALTHAIEGYITKGHCTISDMFHLEAIKLISENLRGAVQNTPEGREGMALGQYIAGMGFSNVGLGIVHSMAHGLSALYDTPHGVACAILLPVGLEYNKSVAGERYRAVGKAMGVVGIDEMNDVEAADATIAAVKQLGADVGIPANLHGILKEEDIQFLAESAFADACRPGNPRDTSVEEIVELYKSQL